MLQIRHKTTYRDRQPTSLGPHRLMLRPRNSRELRLISSELKIEPHATVTFAHGVFGNSIATAHFNGVADTLTIDCVTELTLDAVAGPSSMLRPRPYSIRFNMSKTSEPISAP